MNEPLISSIKKHSYDITAWLEKHAKRVTLPLITAITIQDSGLKAVPLNIQIFPIGLDALCKTDQKNAPKLIKKYFKYYHRDLPKLKRILILATVHHSNPFYYEHLHALSKMLKLAGYQNEIATLELIDKKVTIKTPSKKTVVIHPTIIEDRKLKANGFEPELMHLTFPYSPEVTQRLSHASQPLTPPQKVLTHRGKKSNYLGTFNRLASDFAELADIDPWLMRSEFQVEHHVNFDERNGVEKVAQSTETLLGILQLKYKEYDIDQKPAVRIQNNKGTFGMGIMSVKSSKDLAGLYHLKKKKRTNTKGQAIINDVLVHEEIPNAPIMDKFVVETVILLIGHEVAGGFIRTFSDKANNNLLKSRQQLVLPICLTGNTHAHTQKRVNKKINLLYKNVSRVGGLAVGYEIDHMPS